MTELSISRLLPTATTKDVLDLIAAGLNELAAREGADPVERVSARVVTRFADITRDEHDGRFHVCYYAEASAELAVEERGVAS